MVKYSKLKVKGIKLYSAAMLEGTTEEEEKTEKPLNCTAMQVHKSMMN